MRTVAIVQARVGSTRMPAKCLYPIGDTPMVLRVVERARKIRGVDDVVVAVPLAPQEDGLARVLRHAGVAVVRHGGGDDVVARYEYAAHGAARIVRITGDCPLIDPQLAERVLTLSSSSDYASNVWPTRTYPDGLDVEVFTSGALVWAARHAREREHVGEAVREAPGLRTVSVTCPEGLGNVRWTVDTPEDWEFVCEVHRSIWTHYGAVRQVVGHWYDWRTVLQAQASWACEYCYDKREHLVRAGNTVWDLHVLPASGHRDDWSKGRVFAVCEAPHMARLGGTRR